MQARPDWRECSDTQIIERMLAFNQWFMDNAAQTEPPMALLDTTELTVEGAVQRVAEWVRSRL